jgi:hypothetical protein
MSTKYLKVVLEEIFEREFEREKPMPPGNLSPALISESARARVP